MGNAYSILITLNNLCFMRLGIENRVKQLNRIYYELAIIALFEELAALFTWLAINL